MISDVAEHDTVSWHWSVSSVKWRICWAFIVAPTIYIVTWRCFSSVSFAVVASVECLSIYIYLYTGVWGRSLLMMCVSDKRFLHARSEHVTSVGGDPALGFIPPGCLVCLWAISFRDARRDLTSSGFQGRHESSDDQKRPEVQHRHVPRSTHQGREPVLFFWDA